MCKTKMPGGRPSNPIVYRDVIYNDKSYLNTKFYEEQMANMLKSYNEILQS